MLHQAQQSFVIMNLQCGHFLFRGQKHDARCTCCYLLHDVLLECVLIKPTFIKRKSIHMTTHTAVLNRISLGSVEISFGSVYKAAAHEKKLSCLNDQFLNLLSVTGLLYDFTFIHSFTKTWKLATVKTINTAFDQNFLKQSQMYLIEQEIYQ